MKTCADFGGQTHGGKPCTRKAGWGTGKDTGPCKAHPDEQAGKLEALKRAYVDLIASGDHTFMSAAKKVGSSVTAIWRMRKADKAFDKEIEEWKKQADPFRVEIVEDALFARLAKGKYTAAELIFYLCNRAPHRWRSVQHVEVAGPGGGPIDVEITNARERLASRVAGISTRLGQTRGDPRLN